MNDMPALGVYTSGPSNGALGRALYREWKGTDDQRGTIQTMVKGKLRTEKQKEGNEQ